MPKYDQAANIDRRNRIDYLMAQMRQERSTFYPFWRDIADHIAPTRPRFLVSNANSGTRKNQNIIDSTGSLAARTLRSGMMAGVTSPARPWFRLSTPDLKTNELDPVKYWLDDVTKLMSAVFLKSNLYNALPTIYSDMGIFGTGCLFMEEDPDQFVRFYPFPVGSYFLANDASLKIRVFAREFRLTVRQLLEKFGNDKDGTPLREKQGNWKPDWDNFSAHVQNLWKDGNVEAWIDVTHVIQPNEHWDSNKLEPNYKKYSSVYFESGGGTTHLNRQITDFDRGKFLKDSGYDFFPVLAPRWEVTGEDVYGTNCPGMESLGDVKQLQLGEKRTMQAIDKILNPPMTGPSTLKNKKASILPGDITYLDVREGTQGFVPTYQVNPRVLEIENKQQQIRERISRVFYEDLFLMMANSDRRQITATEIEARQEEKLLALGPVLEQLNQDLLDPLIDNTFAILVERGMIPEAPTELEGQELKVEYESIMAQAQKIVGIGGVERFANFTGQLAQLNPEVLMKINFDQMVDVYGDMTAVPPSLIRSDEEVAAQREQIAAAQQQQATMEQFTQGTQAAKNLSAVPDERMSQIEQLLGQAQAGEVVEGAI
jgi:hypothetical protein